MGYCLSLTLLQITRSWNITASKYYMKSDSSYSLFDKTFLFRNQEKKLQHFAAQSILVITIFPERFSCFSSFIFSHSSHPFIKYSVEGNRALRFPTPLFPGAVHQMAAFLKGPSTNQAHTVSQDARASFRHDSQPTGLPLLPCRGTVKEYRSTEWLRLKEMLEVLQSRWRWCHFSLWCTHPQVPYSLLLT